MCRRVRTHKPGEEIPRSAFDYLELFMTARQRAELEGVASDPTKDPKLKEEAERLLERSPNP
jgi:hypothetical protein